MQAINPTRDSFLAQVQIQHGPPELLGRTILRAYDEAAAKGVSLRFGSVDDLVAVNEHNRDSWVPLVPMFDPRLSELSADNTVCVMGLAADGTVVATQAIRLFDWTTTTLYDEATSLRFFYRDLTASAARGERCIVTAEVAKSMRGRIAFSGATWYHPSFRGRGLIELVPRVARVVSLTRWRFDLLAAIQAEQIALKGPIARSGFKNLATYVTFENSPVGNVRCYLGWATPDELLTDFAEFVDRHATEPPSALRGDRRAQE